MSIAPHVPQYAWPFLLTLLVYSKIQSDRRKTRDIRDADSSKLHDRVLKHDFMITQLKDSVLLHGQYMEDMKDSINAMNVAVAKLDTSVSNLNDAIRNLKR